MTNFFIDDIETGWDGRIYMRSVPGKLDVLELTQPLPCGNGMIPVGFRWNGASSGIFAKVLILNFPKWKHPIATCRHDWRCEKATSKEQRAFADKRFRVDVGKGGTKWEQVKGFSGVRIGAMFGVGSDY
ncbi:hypothetical protein [uncultured Desulfuromusa sp.]|uniref:hypothetical protein n=1 Tax=uncultured Desulfuromusa sp. TaxID=219183 RepID=UPI002AA91808|nr:hypothetical protein [uncultured Desulfuromusa sp.]